MISAAVTANVSELPEVARRVRRDIVSMVHAAGSGHVGGALGIADLLTYLYFRELKIDPLNPRNPERDRFVLSPGHMVPGLYAVLAERGFFPVSELETLRKTGSRLQGHTYRNLNLGVETTGGSLAQGLSMAVGMALAARLQVGNGGSGFHTYCLISDGELNEGQTWESLLLIARERLPNLTIILDVNGIQLSNTTQEIMPTQSIAAKLEAFNLAPLEVDGHSFTEIGFALQKSKLTVGKPAVIVLHTVPGKGVSFMEHKWEWHGKAPNEAEFNLAMSELA